MNYLSALLLVGLGASVGLAAEKPSRSAEAGCAWKPFEFAGLGVKLLYQDCKSPGSHYELSVNKNVLEQHRPSDDRTFVSHTVLEMYEKSATTAISTAIKQKFIETLSAEERRGCLVKKETRKAPAGVERYTVVPTAAYEKLVVDRFNKANPDGGVPYDEICGTHGRLAEGDTYFEFHPGESKTKFAFIVVGQDAPMFDEASIAFLRDAKPNK